MTDNSILWAAYAYNPRVSRIQKALNAKYQGGFLSDELLTKIEEKLGIGLPIPENKPTNAFPTPRSFVSHLPDTDMMSPEERQARLEKARLPEEWYPGIRPYGEAASSIRTDEVKAIVIHATAGSSSEGAASVIKAGRASFHWLIPDEDEAAHGVNIWACVPEKRQAWHVRGSCSHPDVNGGAYSVNNWSLGIELVNAQNKSDQFSDWQVNIAAQIVAYCFFKYPKLKTVVSHAALDPSRREDPSMLFPWRAFLERIDYFIFQHDWEGNSNEIQLRARNVDEIEDLEVGSDICCD